MSIHSHAKKALRRNISQLRSQCAKFVEKFFGTVGAELSFEDLQMLRIRPDLSKGSHLLRTENVHARYWSMRSARNSVAGSLEFKRVVKWRTSPDFVAWRVFDVKAESRLT